MTLKEFTENFMKVNGITGDINEMLKKISDEARKKADDSRVACLSEEEVEQIILGAKLTAEKPKKAPKDKANEKAIEEYNKKMAEDKKVIMWHQKAPQYEVNGEKLEQLDLFGDNL